MQHCFECHAAKKQEGDLRLDSAKALLKGTDNGPVVVPGKPAESKIIEAIRQTGELKMPPKEKEKLSDAAIATLTKWVEIGVPWPDNPALKSPDALSPEEVAKSHWSFRPVQRPSPPAVKDEAACRNGVDRFILAKLEEKGLSLAPAAERRTWLRRVSFDLIGLPPTPAEADDFLRDESPEAYGRVVDRLLASPHFGERWGRYWLDVARYADTKGYVFQEDRVYHYAWVYRDWVVKALNDDLPYDQFVVRQLAADQLSTGDDKRDWAALGFLTLGRRFLNSRPDIIDDRIDVISRGLMGITAGCARCHDHKFDPIPMQDYYALYGVLSPAEEKQIPIAAPSPEFEKELQTRQKAMDDFLNAKWVALKQRLREDVALYLLATVAKGDPKLDNAYMIQREKDLRPTIVDRWKDYLAQSKEHRPRLFAPWHAFVGLKAEGFAEQAAELAKTFVAKEGQNPPLNLTLNPHVAEAFAGDPPKSLTEVAERYAKLFAAADAQWQLTLETAHDHKEPPPAKLADADWQELWEVIHAEGTPTKITVAEAEKMLDQPSKDSLRKLRDKLNEWKNGSAAPVQAMVLQDGPVHGNPRVFLRGNANNPGPEVPRQFFAVVAGKDRQPFKKGSGRLELAEAVTNPTNPLTARVWVNRVWLHLFGAGLVRTPSDFGLRSEPPSHPELLDYLAGRLIDEGWSTKKLLREILLSRVYQQATSRDANDPLAQQATKVDPENRLLWRMNRRRLDLEGLRDALLFASGQLDPALGGPPVEIASPPYSNRRTLYGNIDRVNLPGLFRTFDFAVPDTHSPQRFVTTIPQQALFLLNSPFAIAQAKALAVRPEVKDVSDPEERIQRLYAICFGRPATDEEVQLGRQFVVSAAMTDPADKLSPWERYAQALLMSNEFSFLD